MEFNFVKPPALKGGASRKGNYLFQIASLNPTLKGGTGREANRSIGFDSSYFLNFQFNAFLFPERITSISFKV
jgi:hypothetical protein